LKNLEELEKDGFTASGLSRYQETLEQYSSALHTKSITYGDADKASNMPREVTHDHVRSAAHQIANSFGKDKSSPWWILCQVIEYSLTAISAYALGNTDKEWGTPVFVICAVVAGILIAVRLSKSKSK
jgi:hypothetical protein